MRVTTSMYYKNLYAENNKVAKQLFDVNKQIASGQKIQYAHEDPDTFIQTMRLDDEIATLEQVKKSANSGLQFSTNTDTTMNDMTMTLDAMKVKMIEAANSGVSSQAKLEAIADELAGLRNHMINVANTSINGQHLFSGTAVTTKPVNDDGTYNGNDKDMLAFFGANVEQKYNITGQELFLGEENGTSRQITTNVQKHNQSLVHSDVMGRSDNPDNVMNTTYLFASDTIRDMVGDSDADPTGYPDTHFYIRGTQSDGTSFKEQITMQGTDKVSELLSAVENAFGTNTVNVSLNEYGQIEVTDKFSGSSKLDFHMVAATDFDQADGNDDADVNDPSNTGSIDDLDGGTSDIQDLFDGTNTLLITEFVKSGFSGTSATTIDSLSYDRTAFSVSGISVTSNVAQIVKSDNSFAVDATKLSEVADTTNLATSSLTLQGKHRDGTDFSLTIGMGAPASVAVDSDNDGTTDYTYNVENGFGNTTDGQDMSYRQLMDIINLGVNDLDPTADYNAAIDSANQFSSVNLTSDGKIEFKERSATSTQVSISLFDNNSDDFTANASIMTFNSNNSLEIRDPKTDFFAVLDEAILAVREGRFGADGSGSDPRNSGIENAMQKIDDLSDHIGRQHAQAGVQSQSLQSAIERSDTLILSSMTLRSETIDTDIAEASLRLQQLTLNFEAMLATVGKISQLSLVNYL